MPFVGYFMRQLLTVAVWLPILFSLALTGCTVAGYTVAKQSDIDTRIEAAREETTAKLEELRVKELDLLRQVIAENESRLQAAADYLFKGVIVFGTLKEDQVNRPTMVMGQSINLTATQLPTATVKAQLAALDALKTELDEIKTSTAALKAQYERELSTARAEGAAKAQKVEELARQIEAVKTEKVEVLTRSAEVERSLQAEKDAVQERDLAAARKAEEDAKNVQAIKMRFSAITGILTLLCGAGAAFSPVFKDKLGIAAIGFGLATAAIWYVEGWMVAIAIAVVVLGLAAWALYNHRIESKAATNVFRAVQSFKDTARPEYEQLLRPHLNEWMTRYTKDGAKVPDKAVVAHIDKRLMEVEAK